MDRGHLLLFPFMAQGHLIPFLNLAKLIEQRKRFTITIVNTPLNIAKLQSSLPPNSAIHLIELPFSSSDHGLPPNSENTDSLPLHLFTTFFQATETLRPSFEHLVSSIIQQQRHNHHLCIVADMFLGWTVESAKKLGVFHSVFVTSGAYASAVIFSLWLNPPLPPESYDEVPLVDFPEVKIHHSQLINTIISSDGMDPTTVFLRQQACLSFQSNGLLLNTVEELEKEGLRLLRNISGLPVRSIGPLVCLPSSDHVSDSCMKFLDSNPRASVLYVSFGSQYTIPASQMMELAMGLEASRKPFIWVIRPPSEIEAGEDARTEWLPEGFEDRITGKQQGFLVHGWAPQSEILSHTSTGAFLSHCGWNSVLESLSQGVPIIGWPLLGDQLFNSKMMEEEMGVCVEIARGRGTEALRNGWKGVKEAIELVMGGAEKGREMRRKAGEIREMMAGALKGDGELKGSSFKAMENFLETAFSMRTSGLK